jgi:hypothetical protein
MKLSINKNVHLVEPGDFEASEHWYPRVLNSNIHPLVNYFLNLSQDQMVSRYKRLKPEIETEKLKDLLQYKPKYFSWSGTDMMHVTNHTGKRSLTVIETNSCPSGQKSMPLMDLNAEKGGYKRLMEKTFLPLVQNTDLKGALAVIYDKNPMENIGYASTMADIFGENVYLAKFDQNNEDPNVKFEDGILHVKDEKQEWLPVRAAFRYVTQNPWDRIPKDCKTLLLNPIEACLAGGRNKSEAYLAYQKFNQKYADFGLKIDTPHTQLDANYEDLEALYHQFGKSLVVKVPDSNAGQGVYTITSDKELNDVLEILKPYQPQSYIVQELINSNYIPGKDEDKLRYHVGTIPDEKDRSYAFDIRMMMHYTVSGTRPLAVYSRRARLPLNKPLPEDANSWELYGTNLSVKQNDGWTYDDERLLLYDMRNFGRLGLGIDELIDAFIQSALATFAIDQHAQQLFKK